MALEVRVELAEGRRDLGERDSKRLHAWIVRPRARCRAGIPGYPARVVVQLVYETHAITTDNEAGIATGWLPGELSARGRETAAELGARRRNDGVTAVYVSDLARAVETARIAFEGSGIPIHQDPRLRECDYGRLNGAPVAVLAPQRIHRVDEPWPDGESYRHVVGRTASLLGDLAREWDGARLVLVAHSANRWALEHLLLGRDLRDLVTAEFDWQPGWEFVLPAKWVAGPGWA